MGNQFITGPEPVPVDAFLEGLMADFPCRQGQRPGDMGNLPVPQFDKVVEGGMDAVSFIVDDGIRDAPGDRPVNGDQRHILFQTHLDNRILQGDRRHDQTVNKLGAE